MLTQCPACAGPLPGTVRHQYAQCPRCGSFVFQTDTTAAEDNRNYFDAIFQTTGTRRLDARKCRIFDAYRRQDERARGTEMAAFARHTERVRRMLSQTTGRILEVGFGGGERLAQLLGAAVDAYGEELSATAIANFQQRHPGFATRVGPPGFSPGPFAVLYSAALFEHLDDPDDFLTRAQARLQAGGDLILDNIPLAVEGPSDFGVDDDIGFWKPCHRVLYTARGLGQLAPRTGYSLDAIAMLDSFNYRVLSWHRRAGFADIERLRDSCLDDPRLPGPLRYRWLCHKALRSRARCHVGSAILRWSGPGPGAVRNA